MQGTRRGARPPLDVRKFLFFAVAVTLSYFGHGCAGSSDDAGQILDSLSGLPSNSIAYGTITDLAAFDEGFRGTAVGGIATDPEILSGIERIIAGRSSSTSAPGVRSALSALDELHDVGVQSVAFAAYPTADGRPASFGIRLHCTNAKRAAVWLAARLGQDPPPAEQTGPSCDERHCSGVDGETLLIASDIAAFEVLRATGAGLAQNERTRTIVGASHPPGDGLFMAVDLVATTSVLTATGKDPATYEMTRTLGADALDYMIYTEASRGDSAESRLTVAYDRQEAALLGILLDIPAGETTIDRFVPGDMTVYSLGRLVAPGETYRRLVAAARPLLGEEQMAKFDAAVNIGTGMLGVDIERDILDALGGEIAFAFDDTSTKSKAEEFSLDNTRWLAVIGVSDQAKLDQLLTKLGPLAALSGMSISEETIGDGMMRVVSLLSSKRKVTVALADGRLAIGAQTDDVRTAIEGSENSLARQEAYLERRKELPGEAGWWTFSRSSSAIAATLLPGATPGERMELLTLIGSRLDDVPTGLVAYRQSELGIEIESRGPMGLFGLAGLAGSDLATGPLKALGAGGSD